MRAHSPLDWLKPLELAGSRARSRCPDSRYQLKIQRPKYYAYEHLLLLASTIIDPLQDYYYYYYYNYYYYYYY